MIRDAFQEAGYEEPTIFWSRGETMAAFRNGVTVHCLPSLTKMNRVDSWRTVERFILLGATKHGQPCQMLVFNTHQPASDTRPFPGVMRTQFCKGIIEDALRLHSNCSDMCGWVFGGDANCDLTHWTSAFEQVQQSRLNFETPRFIYGINHKGGDLMVGAAVKGADMDFFENTCTVKGRERQHDCMFLEWCYRAHGTQDPVSLPRKPDTETLEQRKRLRLPQPLPAKKPHTEDTSPRQEEPSKTRLSPAAEDTSPEQEQTLTKISYYTRPKQEQRVTNVL